MASRPPARGRRHRCTGGSPRRTGRQIVAEVTYLHELALEVATSFGDAAGSSITFRHHGAMLRVASSDGASARCDPVESRLHHGPWLQAMKSQEAVLLPRIADVTQWPQWREQALHEGFVSAVAVPAPVAPDVAVALNVYFRSPEPWDDELLAVAQEHARTIARAVQSRVAVLTAAHAATEVRTAMGARVTVEHAVGAIMHCSACSPDEALDVLRRTSADVEVSLEVAARIVVGVLSGAPAGSHARLDER
ncbi:GAF and ANTAR domain-containing protein [Cellulomonas sp. NS3]|uniref:GAF and ANTAR domain-containing protein n=1 Tax=Cellulomonas sp. NS3 TaxID=2973977 RepID=UPI002162583F|nr:GAF and ANTAR domain-containing protein [Cellulomonas sp. NS3]